MKRAFILCMKDTQFLGGVAVLADVSLKPPRKLIIYTVRKHIFRLKASHLLFI